MKLITVVTVALIFILCLGYLPLVGQDCKAEVELVDHKTIRGTITYYLPVSQDSIRFRLGPNGYAGQHTLLADSFFKQFNPCIYFASASDLGGYKELVWTADGQTLEGSYDATQENFKAFPRGAKSVQVSFVLDLPKRCGNFGYDEDYIYLGSWLPQPLDGNTWTYLVMLKSSPLYFILSGALVEEINTNSEKRATFISTAKVPEMALTKKRLTSSIEKDNKGLTYQLYRPDYKKSLSSGKMYRYMHAVSLNLKDSLAKSRIVVDDNRYAKLDNLLFLSRGAIRSSEKSFYPSYRYTDKGNHMIGFSLSNQNKGRQAVYYVVNPYFSFKNDFNWYLGFLKPFRLNKGKISQITPILTYKKFHYYTNEIDDYTLDYHRISPRIKFTFKNHKWVNVEYAFISEQTALYEGRKINFIHLNSNLFRVRYDQTKRSTLYNWAFNSQIERYGYENIFREQHRFVKLSAAFEQTWRTSMKRNFSVRLWASKFISNDERQSTNYSDYITKGSIALIAQGWNDYAYDGVFVARKNQNGILNNQTGNLGGGFKNAPSNTSSLGLSNDFAASINLSYDLFTVTRSFRFFVYGDGGIYRQLSNNQWKMKNLYSAGLGLSVSDYVSLFLPLINHADINNNYRDQGLGFLERWSFSIHFQEKFNTIK